MARNYTDRRDPDLKHIIVEWYDIQTEDNWNEPEDEFFYAHQMENSGWLIYEDSFVIIIASSWSIDEGGWYAKWAIPVGTIICRSDHEHGGGAAVGDEPDGRFVASQPGPLDVCGPPPGHPDYAAPGWGTHHTPLDMPTMSGERPDGDQGENDL